LNAQTLTSNSANTLLTGHKKNHNIRRTATDRVVQREI